MATKISEANVTIAGHRMPLRRVQTIFEDISRTKQSFSKDTNIKTILQRYVKTGVLGDPNKTPMYGDFTKSPDDFVNSINLVTQVRAWFEEKPAEVRARFKNDPVACYEFLHDKKNDEEAVKLGLKPKTVLPEPKNPKPAEHEKPKAEQTQNPTA